MELPDDRRYTKEHEWAALEDRNIVTVGITDYAQDQLGDIVFVELPAEGAEITVLEPFGSIESVKAVSDLFAPVSGTVIEVNGALEDAPEIVNDDPYESAWMIKIEISNPEEFEALMTVEEYGTYVEEEKEKAEALEELDDEAEEEA